MSYACAAAAARRAARRSERLATHHNIGIWLVRIYSKLCIFPEFSMMTWYCLLPRLRQSSLDPSSSRYDSSCTYFCSFYSCFDWPFQVSSFIFINLRVLVSYPSLLAETLHLLVKVFLLLLLILLLLLAALPGQLSIQWILNSPARGHPSATYTSYYFLPPTTCNSYFYLLPLPLTSSNGYF